MIRLPAVALIWLLALMAGAAPPASSSFARVEVLLRTHSDADTEILRREGLGTVFMGEAELARAMTDRILSDWEARRAAAATSEGQAHIRTHSS